MKRYTLYLSILLFLGMMFSCSKEGGVTMNENPNPSDSLPDNPPRDTTHASDQDIQGKMPEEIKSDIKVLMRAKKINQLVGDFDREKQEPTQNQTFSSYQLKETDLGVPFRFAGKTYVLFGDSHGGIPGNRDAIAYTTDTHPEEGISLQFLHDDQGVFLPITIPSVSLEAFEVPVAGVEVEHTMYIYATTNHSAVKTMGKSVLARSYDEGHTFDFIYSLSSLHFINVSLVKTKSEKFEQRLPTEMNGEILMLFGSGDYRNSDVYLACQPAKSIEKSSAIRYFAGLDEKDKPLWSKKEKLAIPLFDQPQVGELSVTYNKFIKRWVMLYNASDPRGINLRTANNPWGPWSKPEIVFDPWEDNGYCYFMHTSWDVQQCDHVMDPGRENEWGGEYGPYQYPYFAKGENLGKDSTTTIYFNMSTWNPYTVVLMKTKLGKID